MPCLLGYERNRRATTTVRGEECIFILIHSAIPLTDLFALPSWMVLKKIHLGNSTGEIRPHTLLILSQLTLPLVYDAVT